LNLPPGASITCIPTLARPARWHRVTCRVSDCRDHKDNKFLELAFEASAAMIVSGDNDLLCLHPWHRIPMMSPSTFLAMTPPAAN